MPTNNEYWIFIDFIGYRPIFAIFICFLLLGNGKISLMIITPSAANRIITNSLSHLFVKCCITNVLCVYKLPLCLTIFYSYICICSRLYVLLFSLSFIIHVPPCHALPSLSNRFFQLIPHTKSSFNIFLSANIVAYYYHSSIIIQ